MHRSARIFIGIVLIPTTVCGCRISYVPPAPAAPAQAAKATSPALTVAKVRQALSDAVNSFPSDPNGRLELALFDLKTNALDLAERELIACWKQFPQYGRAPYHLGMYYLAQTRERDAIPCLRAAAAASPNDTQILWAAGQASYQAGDQKRAIDYAERAIAVDPLAPEPYLLLARCYDHHGTANLSIANLKSYLERSGNPAPGYSLLGRVYFRQGDRDRAQQWLQRAVEAEPNNAESWVALGRLYFERFNATQAEEGIRCYEKALAIDANNQTAHQYLGHALLDRQQYEAAIPHLRASLQNAPDPGPQYYDLSQALLKAGHEVEGRKALAA
jgi:tetratricopeptide (TPR) repeat protein